MTVITESDRHAYLAAFGNLPAEDKEAVLAGKWDETTSMQAISAYRVAVTQPLTSAIVRLRSFIKSIDDDWVASEPAGDDDWSDGYEDCLAEYAKKARECLAHQVQS